MRKLYRSRRDKKLFGLCGGISEVMGVDATLLRVLAVVIAVFSSGVFIPIYILAALVVPKEEIPYDGFGPGPGGYGYGGTHTPGGGYYNNPTPPPGQGWSNWQQPPAPPHQAPPQSPSNLDAMMDDLEKKALRRELEELKAKLAKYEKGE
jgi:phage shock protein C